jgi:hypothetical protein
LGLLAAVGNFLALRGQLATKDYVVARESVEAGRVLGKDTWAKVTVRADHPDALVLAIAWEERGIVDGKILCRSLRKGELILRSDVEPVTALQPPLPGEKALTLTLRKERYPRGLEAGTRVEILYDTGDGNAAVRLPVCCFLGAVEVPPIGERAKRGPVVRVTVALPPGYDFSALEKLSLRDHSEAWLGLEVAAATGATTSAKHR